MSFSRGNNRPVRLFTTMPFAMVVLAILIGSFPTARAAAPVDALSYQGRLLDSNGIPVADASLEFVFRLFDAASGGTCLWESDDGATCDAADETQTVALTDGLFSENIGSSVDPDGLSEAYPVSLSGVFEDNTNVYLEVVVGGETLSPRKQVVAAPYALNAQSLDGMDSSEFLAATGDTGTGIFDFTGAVLSGGSPLAFEGATANDFESTVAFTDATADRTITFQDASGTVAFLSDVPSGAALWESGASATYEDDDDVVVGTSGDETIGPAGFSLGGNDLFVAGDIGVEGSLYTDAGIVGGAAFIDFSEFDVSATTGSVTINDAGDAGQISVEGTLLTIDSLDFVGGGSISSPGELFIDSSQIEPIGSGTTDLGDSGAGWANVYVDVAGTSISLESATSATDAGAFVIGAFDEFANSTGANVQDVLDDLDAAISAGGTGAMWTLSAGVVYPSSAASDLAVGGTTAASSPFGVDESANTVYVGEGSGGNGSIVLKASDADIGSLSYTTDDRLVLIGGDLFVGSTSLGAVEAAFAPNGDDLYVAGDIAAQTNVYANSFVAGDASTTFADGAVTTAGTTDLLLTIAGGDLAFAQATTIGDGGDALAVNTSDWDISSAGNLSGIGTISADGAASLGSTLDVDGASDFGGDITFSAATPTVAIANTEVLTVTDGTNTLFSITDGGTVGNAAITGTLAVTGASTLTGALTANGGISADGGVFTVADTSGNVATSGTLTVSGNSVLLSADIGGGYGATGVTVTSAGNLSANGNLVVDGTSTLAGGVTLSGALTVGGTLAANGAVTLGDGGDTIGIDSSDWDISAGGALTGVGPITSDGAYTSSGVATDFTTGANEDLTLAPNGTGDLVVSTDADTQMTLSGIADGTDSLVLTSGDIRVMNGDLDVDGGDFNVVLDAGDGVNISKGAGPSVDVVTIAAGSASIGGIDALAISLTSTDQGGQTHRLMNGSLTAEGTEADDIAVGLFLDLASQAGGTEKAIEIENTAAWNTDIELQNDETISNATDGTIALGATTVSASGALTVAGTFTANGTAAIGDGGDTVTVNSSDWDISATGDASGFGALSMDGNFSQSGATTFSTGSGAISLNGAVSAASTLGVTGATTLSSTLAVTGALTANGGISADAGVFTVTDATGAIHTSSTLDVDSTSDLGGDITFSAGTPTIAITNGEVLSITDGTNTLFSLTDAGTAGNAAISGTLAVTGASTLTGAVSAGSTLGVTGATTLSSTLGVTGTTTLSGALAANGSVTLGDGGDAISIDSSDWDISSTGDMTGIGLVTMNGALSGATSISTTGDLTVSGGDITGSNSESLDIGEATDATFTFGRNDAGTVILTAADTDATAAMLVTPGGSAQLTLGDTATGTDGDTVAIFSSDWEISTGGDMTGIGLITMNGALSGATSISTTGDLTVSGGDITGSNSETIDIGEAADDFITFTGAGGTDNTSLSIDLDGTRPEISSEDTSILFADVIEFDPAAGDANLVLYASDADQGSFSYSTDDTFVFSGGNISHSGNGTLPTTASGDTNLFESTATFSGTSSNTLGVITLTGGSFSATNSATEGTATDHLVIGAAGYAMNSGTTGQAIDLIGVHGLSTNASTNATSITEFMAGVHGEATATAAGVTVPDARGLSGKASVSAGTVTDLFAVRGAVTDAAGTATNAYGGYFTVADGTTRYGVYSTASGGTTNYAGFFHSASVSVETSSTASSPDFSTGAGDLFVDGQLEVDADSITTSTAIDFTTTTLTSGVGLNVQRASSGTDFSNTSAGLVNFAITDTASTGNVLSLIQDGTGMSLFVDPDADTGNTVSDTAGGAVHVTNTGNADYGLSVYTNQAVSDNALAYFFNDNAAFDDYVVEIQSDATEAGTDGGTALHIMQNEIDATAANSVGTHAMVIDVFENFGAADGVQDDGAVIKIREDVAGTANTIFRLEGDGDLFADGTLGTAAADLAETYPSTDTLVPGELVAFDPSGTGVLRSMFAYQPELMGAVSTVPGVLLGSETDGYKIALSGRIPLSVSAENGAIAPGDPITSSSTPGVGMKATEPGMIVGFALDDFVGPGNGSISVFINPHFYVGNVIATDGSVTQIEDDVELTGSFSVLGAGGGVTEGMTLVTDVTDATDYRLSIENADGVAVAYVSNEGDLALSGRLYPSDRGAIQTSKYIYYDGSSGMGGDFMRTNASGWATGSYDFAEMFPSSDALEPGDVVVFGLSDESVAASGGAYEPGLAGIISTRPGFLAGENEAGQYPVALAGRVPTKVSAENGSIRIGDPLTSSSVPGYAMRADKPGPIVGYALEPFDGTAGDDRIIAFVNVSYWDGGATEPLPGTQNVASTIVVTQNADNLTALNMNGNVYMTGNDVLGVRRIAGIGERWSVEEDGTIRTGADVRTVTESYQGERVETVGVTSPDAQVTLFGTATLTNGEAVVRFEDVSPSFNDVTALQSPVRVIVTPNGPVSLYVFEKDNDGFGVRQVNGSDNGVTFDWMVSAYRKGYEPEEEEESGEGEVISDQGSGISDQEAEEGTDGTEGAMESEESKESEESDDMEDVSAVSDFETDHLEEEDAVVEE